MELLSAINDVLWHETVIYTVLGVGVLFTLWSGFCQYRALTHGVALISGKHDRPGAPGAINHFQALSTALSATVGLGNIAGVAIAVSVGGPGAVFWMWVTGFVGMALKMVEVTQAMLYRNLERPEEPRGGAMWVASRGFASSFPRLKLVGRVLAAFFCAMLLVSTVTGGNMFQAWNVADVTRSYFGVPRMLSGAVMAVLVALVILGGIHRIGTVTGKLVPFMCVIYLVGGFVVLGRNVEQVPALIGSIVTSAFSPSEAQGAFLGGTAGWAFLKGVQRALFSNEAGQGSSPIAHSAVKTDEPVSEGVVAGLEPFVDTIVVCTVTSLVILSSGVWNRPADLSFREPPRFEQAAASTWTALPCPVVPSATRAVSHGDPIFTIVAASANTDTGNDLRRVHGVLRRGPDGGHEAVFDPVESPLLPEVASEGAYFEDKGATLTARAFDAVLPGLGRWIVPVVVWLFAISTMISWSYYGEQGVAYLFGSAAVLPYRAVYCALVFVSTTPWIATEEQLDAVSTLGTGAMLLANLPILLVFAPQAMSAYRAYLRRLG